MQFISRTVTTASSVQGEVVVITRTNTVASTSVVYGLARPFATVFVDKSTHPSRIFLRVVTVGGSTLFVNTAELHSAHSL